MPAQRDATGAPGVPADESTTVRLTPEQAGHVSEVLWLDLDEVRSPKAIEDIHRLRDELATSAQRLADLEEVKEGRSEVLTAPVAELVALAGRLIEAGAYEAAILNPERPLTPSARREALREAEVGIAILDQLTAAGAR